MKPAYSVMLFTTLTGMGYGLLALLGLVGFNHGQASSFAFGATASLLALGLITLGLLIAGAHLGNLGRAMLALSQWRSSWLSREVVAAVLTYIAALLFALFWTGLWQQPRWIATSGLVTFAMCTITVFCTSMMYASLKTFRAWHSWLTPAGYLIFALVTGGCLMTAVATMFDRYQVFQIILTIPMTLLLLLCKFLYWRRLDKFRQLYKIQQATGLQGDIRQWQEPHSSVNFAMKEMDYIIARKHALKVRSAVYGLLLLTIVLLLACQLSPWFSCLAVVSSFSAALVERWLFFAEAQHVSSLSYGATTA